MVIERKYTDQLIVERLDRIVELLKAIAQKTAEPAVVYQATIQSKQEAPVPVYVSEKEAARITGLSTAWFQRARWAGNGPPFIKLGGAHRKVQYNREELLKWFEARKVNSTSDDVYLLDTPVVGSV